MLNGGDGNCNGPNQDKRKTENSRRKRIGSRRSTRRFEGNKLKEEAEPRDNKP